MLTPMPQNHEDLSTWNLNRLFLNWQISERRLKHWHGKTVTTEPLYLAAMAYIKYYQERLQLIYHEILNRIDHIPIDVLLNIIDSGLCFYINSPQLD